VRRDDAGDGAPQDPAGAAVPGDPAEGTM
jgi:hypothetical protein